MKIYEFLKKALVAIVFGTIYLILSPAAFCNNTKNVTVRNCSGKTMVVFYLEKHALSPCDQVFKGKTEIPTGKMITQFECVKLGLKHKKNKCLVGYYKDNDITTCLTTTTKTYMNIYSGSNGQDHLSSKKKKCSNVKEECGDSCKKL